MASNITVLNSAQIQQKTERIAFEIIENTFEVKKIYVAGIDGNGYLFAERLIEKLNQHSDQEFRLFKISLDKEDPMSHPITLSVDENELDGSTVVLVDDVINSGRTMIHSVKKLLDHNLRSLKVATLVNRTHRRFPVKADFVGVNISTTLQENVIVELDQQDRAYLE